MNTVYVRQGALVIHVEPDGSCKWEVSMPVPKEFTHDVFSIRRIKNTKYVRKEFNTIKAANRFKVQVQIAVTQYKISKLIQRKSILISKNH